jgi:hypothetical protein
MACRNSSLGERPPRVNLFFALRFAFVAAMRKSPPFESFAYAKKKRLPRWRQPLTQREAKGFYCDGSSICVKPVVLMVRKTGVSGGSHVTPFVKFVSNAQVRVGALYSVGSPSANSPLPCRLV